jgi:hypothetical protein
MAYAKTSQEGIIKNLETNAVINTNISEYERLLDRRKQMKGIQHLQSQIDHLKKEFSDIKNLIHQIIGDQ